MVSVGTACGCTNDSDRETPNLPYADHIYHRELKISENKITTMERGACGRGRRAGKPHRSISTKLRTSKEETLVQKNMKRQRKARVRSGAIVAFNIHRASSVPTGHGHTQQATTNPQY